MQQYPQGRLMLPHCLLAILIFWVGSASPSRAEQSVTDRLSVNARAAVDPNQHDQVRKSEVDSPWETLLHKGEPLGFRELGGQIRVCGDVRLETGTDRLVTVPGEGVLAALKKIEFGDNNNLLSKKSFGDCEINLEFLLGKGSNSGVKIQQRYEIQLYDSHGKQTPSALDCGGIYPHWVFRNNGNGIRYLDDGIPPRRNAAKPAGEWQQLHVIFRAPRFDDAEKKIRNARFELVALNDEVIHHNVEVDSPTGNTSNPMAEVPLAPLYLQFDHGAVAFRNIHIRPLQH